METTNRTTDNTNSDILKILFRSPNNLPNTSTRFINDIYINQGGVGGNAQAYNTIDNLKFTNTPVYNSYNKVKFAGNTVLYKNTDLRYVQTSGSTLIVSPAQVFLDSQGVTRADCYYVVYSLEVK